jgi:hypothetical protein
MEASLFCSRLVFSCVVAIPDPRRPFLAPPPLAPSHGCTSRPAVAHARAQSAAAAGRSGMRPASPRGASAPLPVAAGACPAPLPSGQLGQSPSLHGSSSGTPPWSRRDEHNTKGRRRSNYNFAIDCIFSAI